MSDNIKSVRGVIEVSKYDLEGNLVQHYIGENTVMRWAKHAIMHMMTGESFSTHGRQRDISVASGATSHTVAANTDGTIISGNQHFTTNSDLLVPGGTDYFWSKPGTMTADGTDESLTNQYPIFPTKLLLGTGFEFYPGQMSSGSSDIYGAPFYTYYISNPSPVGAWTNAQLTTGPTTGTTSYSAYFNNTNGIVNGGNPYSYIPTRTMNDIAARDLTGFAFPQEAGIASDGAWGVPGAVKNGGYTDTANLNTYCAQDGNGNYYLKNDYSGLGDPSFIYPKHSSRYFQSGTEVALNQASYLGTTMETNMTYSFTLPAQTGASAGTFYPYNGYTLKVAGLFCDARFTVANNYNTPSNPSNPSYIPFQQMPFGMMFARRAIPPFTKTHDTSIVVKWSIYI